MSSGGFRLVKQQQSSGLRTLDTSLWLLVAILIGGALFANYHFQYYAWALRLAAWLILICITIAIILLTEKGQSWKIFFNEARMEMRKVVWPTRQSTVQMTIMVMIVVVVTSLVLWLMDTIFVKIIQLLTFSS